MAKWLTRWSAKPVFMGSNPIRCSILLTASPSAVRNRSSSWPRSAALALALGRHSVRALNQSYPQVTSFRSSDDRSFMLWIRMSRSPLWSKPPNAQPRPECGVVTRGPASPVRCKFGAWLTDVAAMAGLHAPVVYGVERKEHILKANGCACAFLDFDDDG